MTRDEHEPQQVVADLVFVRGVERLHEIWREVRFECFEVRAHRLVCACMRGRAP